MERSDGKLEVRKGVKGQKEVATQSDLDSYVDWDPIVGVVLHGTAQLRGALYHT